MKQRLLLVLFSLLCIALGVKAQSGMGASDGGVLISFTDLSPNKSTLSKIILSANAQFISTSQTTFDVRGITGAPYGKATFTKGQQYHPTGKPIDGSFGVLNLEQPITQPGTYFIAITDGTFQFDAGPNTYSRFETTLGDSDTGGETGGGGEGQGGDVQPTKQYTFTFTKEGFGQDERLNVYLDGYRRNEGEVNTVNEGAEYGVLINPTSKYARPKLYNQDGTLLGEPELTELTDDNITYNYSGTVTSDLNFIVKMEQLDRTLYDIIYTVEGMKDDGNELCYFYHEQDRDKHNTPMTADQLYQLSEEYELQFTTKCDLSKRKVEVFYNDGNEVLLNDEGDGYWQNGTMRVNQNLNIRIVFSYLEGAEEEEGGQNPPREELNLAELDKIISDASMYYYSIEKENPDIATALKAAIDEAIAVRDGETSTQDDVDASVKTLTAAYDNAQSNAKEVISLDEFHKAYDAANAYYEEISSTYSEVAREFYSAYYRISIDVLWGFAETQKQVNTITAQILKATKKAKDAVAKAKAGYDIKALTTAIDNAVSYFNNIVDDHAAIAAALRDAINTANATKENITSQAQVDNAVIAIQNAVAEAMAAVKNAVGEETKKQGLAYVTYADAYGSGYRRKQYAYDEQGRITQALGMIYNSGEDTWELDTCYTYEYPDQFTTIEYGKIEKRGESTLIGTTPQYSWEWMYKKVTVKTATAEEVKTYDYDRDNEAWRDEPNETITTEYDSQGRMTKKISQYYMTECSYEGNKKTTTEYSCWDGTGNYSPDKRRVEERDGNNNVILEEDYNYTKGDWMIGNKSEYFYTEDNTYAGKKSYGFSNGVQSYVADDTYRIERDEQNRVVRKIRNSNNQVYSTITYDGYVSTEKVGTEKEIIRAVDGDGNLTRYMLKESWGSTMHTAIDMRYEYDRSVLAEDVLNGMVYLREPNQYDYDSPRPDQITYKLKYALARKIACGAYKDTETIYSLQPTTVQPAQYDPEAEEPVIIIPIATIVDKVDIDDGAVIEIVDEAGNVVYETVVDKSNPYGTDVKDGSVEIKDVRHSYHKPGAMEFYEKEGEEMKGEAYSRIKAYRYAAKERVAEANATTTISSGRYFVQIGGGAVKINGKAVNQISAALNIEKNDGGTSTDISVVTDGIQENVVRKPVKLMHNGRLVIRKNGKMYNVNGIILR